MIAPPNPYMSGSPKRRRIIFFIAIAAVLIVVGVVVALSVFSANASKPSAPKQAAAAQTQATTSVARALSAHVSHGDIRVIQLPTLALPAVGVAAAQPEPAAAAPATDPAAAPTSYSINVATVGRQAALDQCVWVRMSFSAAVPVPFVAAHNYCGGAVVLDMQAGQIVTLSGTGLDGTYVVSGAKDAWSGMEALDAMAGLSGDVILQSCYWSDDGRERLVALTRT